jgi:hypothetical protein
MRLLPTTKKALLLISTCSLMAVSASAATVTQNISGNLGNWKAWDNLNKTQFGNNYAQSVAGHDLTNTDEDGYYVAAGVRPFQLSLTGSISYDNVTGAISALNISQVGSFTGGFTYGYNNYQASDRLTFSNLSWTLVGNTIRQTNGSAVGCSDQYAAAYCLGIREGVNANDHSNNLYGQSLFDFQGINAGFQVLPRSNAGNFNFGTDHYKTWAQTPGLSGLIVNPDGSIALTVASMIDSHSPVVNYSNMATFSFQAAPLVPAPVPVPAAAWLMGSGLLSLGLMRKK